MHWQWLDAWARHPSLGLSSAQPALSRCSRPALTVHSPGGLQRQHPGLPWGKVGTHINIQLCQFLYRISGIDAMIWSLKTNVCVCTVGHPGDPFYCKTLTIWKNYLENRYQRWLFKNWTIKMCSCFIKRWYISLKREHVFNVQFLEGASYTYVSTLK